MTGGQDQAADVLEVIRRHCRSITIALAAVDLAHPGAAVITERMRSTIEVINVDLGELKHFLPKRPEV